MTASVENERSPTLTLAMALIERPSVTPDDAGCQRLMAERLSAAGFQIEHLGFGKVDNLWARRGIVRPLFVFVGHTDVVPPGPLEEWRYDPFSPTIRNGHLFGRGAADMKGSLAAMVVAAERFTSRHPDHGGSIAFLITSDEEGDASDGTVKVIEHLTRRQERIDWCLVGEPSSDKMLGDTVKNGRRGSLSATLRVFGVQGHVAYPDRASNPIHLAGPALTELCATVWDHGNAHYPPTSFQVSNIHSGTGADNVIPGELEVMFNFRYGTETGAERLKQLTSATLDRHRLDYELTWRLSGEPFLTRDGRLLAAVRSAVQETMGLEPRLSTAGGTSDGRFVAPTGAEVIELGPINATIHKIDECVPVADLDRLAVIYEQVLTQLLRS